MAVKKAKNRLVILILTMVITFVGAYAKVRNPFKKPAIVALMGNNENISGKKDDISSVLNSLKVTGILNGEIAIINHQFYRNGDKIKVFTVKSVDSNKVVLTANGKDYELILDLSKEFKETKKDKKTLIKEHYK